MSTVNRQFKDSGLTKSFFFGNENRARLYFLQLTSGSVQTQFTYQNLSMNFLIFYHFEFICVVCGLGSRDLCVLMEEKSVQQNQLKLKRTCDFILFYLFLNKYVDHFPASCPTWEIHIAVGGVHKVSTETCHILYVTGAHSAFRTIHSVSGIAKQLQ